MMIINFTCEDNKCIPYKKHNTDAGYDLKSNMEFFDIYPGEFKQIWTGIKIEIPEGYMGMIVPRSGLGSKGFALRNTFGIIDSDYRGEIILMVTNNSSSPISINKYDRVAQLIFVPVLLPTLNLVTELNITNRGEGGFGHTGHN
jgi:dUTP pyrophosphatase